MSKHEAEYFRRRRRSLGIPEREPFPAAEYVQRGLELNGLKQLPWPTDIFGDPVSIAELMAEAAELSLRQGNVRPAGPAPRPRRERSNANDVDVGAGNVVQSLW